MSTKRPLGLTLLSLFLAWLTIAGIGNAWIFLTGKSVGMPLIFGYLAAAYALMAFLACIGLWQMKFWGIFFLRGWMIICGLLSLGFVVVYGGDNIFGGYAGAAIFLTVVGSLFWRMNRYVVSRISPAQEYQIEPNVK